MIIVHANGKVFNLEAEYGLELIFTKVGGWQLWTTPEKPYPKRLIAGEFDKCDYFKVEINGQVVREKNASAD